MICLLRFATWLQQIQAAPPPQVRLSDPVILPSIRMDWGPGVVRRPSVDLHSELRWLVEILEHSETLFRLFLLELSLRLGSATNINWTVVNTEF